MPGTWRLSRVAESDLRSILAASLERWAELGRSRYAALIYAAFETIAGRPSGPLTHGRDELMPGLRSIHLKRVRANSGVRAPVHVVFFRSGPRGSVEIVRVLHDRVDPLLHLGEE